MKTIIFGCGGTLGHINPAIAMADYLKKEFNIIFIASIKEKNNNTFDGLGYKVHYFESCGFNRKYILKNINNYFINRKTKNKITKLMKKENPDIVISMGGSIGTLAILAAIHLKIKTVIHEQNAVIGFGNRMVMKKVNKVLLSYPIKNLKNSVVVGNPMRYHENLVKGFEDTFLIVSGSNGAKVVNDFFIDNIKRLNIINYNVVIIVGSKYYQENIEKIKNIKSDKITIIEKTNNMEKYYKRAFIVVSRAGATTINELINFRKISILIPSHNVTNNHQYHNAKYYYEKGCFEMLLEKDLNVSNINRLFLKMSGVNQRKKYIENIDKNKIINIKEEFLKEIKRLIYE